MATSHVTRQPEWSLKHSVHTLITPVLDFTESIKTRLMSVVAKEAAEASVLSATDTKKEVLKVLERAAGDNDFIAQLTDQGSRALRGYNLTMAEQAALVSGDIRWIEAHVGKLDERLSTWLRCRLQQEIW